MPMICPKCEGQLRQYERSGVTVDQCTDCRGIFLDRGELERLIDAEQAWQASAALAGGPPPVHQAPAPAPAPQYAQQHQAPPGRGWRDHDSDEYPVYGHGGHGSGGYGNGGHGRKKRRSFLEDLFD